MDLQDEKVTLYKVDAEGNVQKGKREMSKTQFALIGEDPAHNGGWKLGAPKEAASVPSPELLAARAKFEELHPGEKAGNKKLDTLLEAIAKASHPNE